MTYHVFRTVKNVCFVCQVLFHCVKLKISVTCSSSQTRDLLVDYTEQSQQCLQLLLQLPSSSLYAVKQCRPHLKTQSVKVRLYTRKINKPIEIFYSLPVKTFTLVAFGLLVCDLHFAQTTPCGVNQKKWCAGLFDAGNTRQISVGENILRLVSGVSLRCRGKMRYFPGVCGNVLQ